MVVHLEPAIQTRHALRAERGVVLRPQAIERGRKLAELAARGATDNERRVASAMLEAHLEREGLTPADLEDRQDAHAEENRARRAASWPHDEPKRSDRPADEWFSVLWDVAKVAFAGLVLLIYLVEPLGYGSRMHQGRIGVIRQVKDGLHYIGVDLDDGRSVPLTYRGDRSLRVGQRVRVEEYGGKAKSKFRIHPTD